MVATGMAAVGTLALSLLSQGDEIVVHQTLYSNTVAMMSGRTSAVWHQGRAGRSDRSRPSRRGPLAPHP